MIYSKIIATGQYLPAHVVTNKDLERIVDTSDQWIVERTGIRTRHLAAQHEGTCDMAEKAARQALQRANWQASDLDLILVATTTPDRIYPSTACLLQDRLDNHTAAAFDLQAVCSGFVYALTVADKFIQTGQAKRVLVVGADTYSRILDWYDRNTCVLFGDGAGAFLLSNSEQPGILSTRLHADGRYKDILTVRGTISQGKVVGSGFTHMEGGEVFKFAVKVLAQIVQEILDEQQLDIEEIDWLIPHQANIRIIEATAKKLKLPMEKIIITLVKHGNTSAASIPLAFDTAVQAGQIQRGQRIILDAVGGGFTWGGVLLKY